MLTFGDLVIDGMCDGACYTTIKALDIDRYNFVYSAVCV